MATFSSHNRSTAEVPASRQQIWDVLRDPEALAELTPLVERITVDGDRWTWQLHGVSALGVQMRAVEGFVRMINEEGGIAGRKLTFLLYDDGFSPPKTLEQVRRQGYALLAGYVHPDATGIAVPIRNGLGEVVAALSVIVPNDDRAACGVVAPVG